MTPGAAQRTDDEPRSAPTEGRLMERASPLVKLAVGVAWLLGLTLSLDLRAPLVLIAVTLAATVSLASVTPSSLFRGLVPVAVAAMGIGVANALFAGANADPRHSELWRLGAFRVTHAALDAGLALALRVLAIGSFGICFGLTTDATRLVDSLVQQGRVPERFAYGALAAYQAVPRFAEDLSTLRQARRIRGLAGSWHPRLLVALLVLAIRRADRLALAMDARAFGSGPRTRFRIVRWTRADLALALGGATALVVALAVTRT